MPGVSKDNIRVNAYDNSVELQLLFQKENIMRLLKYPLKQILKQPSQLIKTEYLK